MTDRPLVITISHQLGSGGAALGQALSDRLEIPLIDREILNKVADQLHVAESELAGREERLTTFWQSLSRVAVFTNPAECLAVDHYEPTDRDLFLLESNTIRRIAAQKPAIFVGRCGRWILRDHSAHFSILVHANLPERVARVQELFCLPPDEARKLIETNDRERAAYIRTFAHEDWLDARLYDLCANTSRVGLSHLVDLVVASVAEKLPA